MKFTVKLPNFTMTRGKVPGKSGGGGALVKLRRNMRQIALWGSVGFFFFILFAWLSLPTRALAWRISHEAKKQGYLVDVEDISISPFGGVTLENVRWTYEPSRPGQVPMKFEIEEVDVDISLMSLMVGNIDVDLEFELDEGNDGRVTANYYKGSDESSFNLEIADLPLYRIPKATQALNAPLRGILAIKVDLTMPEHKFGDAEGFIDITCAACTLGDGVEKLYVPGSKALKSGVVVPEIDVGTLAGRMTVEGGVAETDGPIETNSDDVWIQLAGKINFKDPFAKGRFDMVLKFNLSDRLQDESEPMKLMIQTANPKSKLDPPEKGQGFRIEGSVINPRFVPIKSRRRQSRAEKRAQQREREDKRRRSRANRSRKSRDKAKDAAAAKGKDKEKPTIGEPLDVTPLEPNPTPATPAPTKGTSEEPPSEEPAAAEPAAEEPAAEEGGGEEAAADEGGEDNNAGEEQQGEDGEVAGGGGEGDGAGLDEGGEVQE